MAVLNFSAPILRGKTGQWRAFHAQFEQGAARRADLEDQMRRYGITRQVVSLQQPPGGDFVNVFFEGDNPGAVMAGLGDSDVAFDKWFAARVLEIHGIDVTQPSPGPMAETILEISL